MTHTTLEEKQLVEKLVDELRDKSVTILYYKLKSSCTQLELLMLEVIKLTRQLQEICPHPEVTKYTAIDDHSPPTFYYCKVCQSKPHTIDSTKSKVVNETQC